jgi:hypothetical protein
LRRASGAFFVSAGKVEVDPMRLVPSFRLIIDCRDLHETRHVVGIRAEAWGLAGMEQRPA